jgi:diguanylate cyclase (GGDEF)-like protein
VTYVESVSGARGESLGHDLVFDIGAILSTSQRVLSPPLGLAPVAELPCMVCSPNFEETPHRVLVVDDNELERMLIRHRLRPDHLELIEACNGRSAIELAHSATPDLILLDIKLPDLTGYEVLRFLKDDPTTRSIPVMFISCLGSTEDKVLALDLGAVDFITKPFDPAELRARVRVCLRLKYYQDLLEKQAHLDALTGLANRLALEHRLEAEWSACQRRGANLSLLIIDLDHFKRINDRFGHSAGDEALRRAAGALKTVARTSDLIARYGGEEFVMVAPDCDFMGAAGLGVRAREQVEAIQIDFDGEPATLTASVGLATTSFSQFDQEDPAPLALLGRADRALYEAKSAGRNAVWAWNEDSLSPVGGKCCPILT